MMGMVGWICSGDGGCIQVYGSRVSDDDDKGEI